MPKKSFSVFEFAGSGLRAALENVQLVVLTLLAFSGVMFGVLGVLALIIRPALVELWPMIKGLRAQLGSCANMAECGHIRIEIRNAIFSLMQSQALLFVICALILLIVFAGLTLGVTRIVLDVQDKGKSQPGRLFSCFHLIPKFLIAGFMLVSGVLAGLVFFIVPGVILFLRLRFFHYFLVDKNVGIIESLRKSFNATRGLAWDVLGLQILASIFMMIPFGFVPSCLMIAAAYLKLPKTRARRA